MQNSLQSVPHQIAQDYHIRCSADLLGRLPKLPGARITGHPTLHKMQTTFDGTARALEQAGARDW